MRRPRRVLFCPKESVNGRLGESRFSTLMAKSKRSCGTGPDRRASHCEDTSKYRAQGAKARRKAPRHRHGPLNNRANMALALATLLYAGIHFQVWDDLQILRLGAFVNLDNRLVFDR
jgi:hypothetical protein